MTNGAFEHMSRVLEYQNEHPGIFAKLVQSAWGFLSQILGPTFKPWLIRSTSINGIAACLSRAQIITASLPPLIVTTADVLPTPAVAYTQQQGTWHPKPSRKKRNGQRRTKPHMISTKTSFRRL
jgi:hypothetical protein